MSETLSWLVIAIGIVMLGCALWVFVIREMGACDSVCSIEYRDGTSERVACRHADVDGAVLVLSTDGGRTYRPLAAIKRFTTREGTDR